jgi:SAM-dependent methyltransferase
VLRAARLARQRLGRLSGLITCGDSVLDVGAGGGEFLYLVRAAGCQATGIEPNLGYAGYAREELGLDVRPGFPEDHDFGPCFRLITLFHVLEHLADPVEGLRRLAGWLLPGGCLAVEVPNFEFACQHPAHRFHRAHLFHFNSATLRRCGERAGLTPVSAAFSEDGGVLTAIFRMDGAAPSPPEPVAGNLERLWKIERERRPARYWLSPATWRHTAARLRRMTGERLAARRFPSRRAILDALAGPGTPAGVGRI